jgi:hypothetical protein
VRGLRKTPRFAIAALLTVVLGVGANATIFSVLNPLLFKPLPYPEPDRIVHVFRTSPQSDRWPHAPGNYLDHRDRNTVFEHLAAMTWRDASLADPDQPAERLLAIRASGNFFAVLGGAPLLGRVFEPSDDSAGAAPVVVLSHRLWQRRFAGDRSVIGRSIRLDGQETTVIGVMPEDYEYPLFWRHRDLAPAGVERRGANDPDQQLPSRVRPAQTGRHAGAGGLDSEDARPAGAERAPRARSA